MNVVISAPKKFFFNSATLMFIPILIAFLENTRRFPYYYSIILKGCENCSTPISNKIHNLNLSMINGIMFKVCKDPAFFSYTLF